MRVHRIPYASTHRFAPIVTALLEGDPLLRSLQAHPRDAAGLAAAAAQRRFSPTHRATLVEALHRQYAGLDLMAAERSHLDALAQEGTLTVTTGHQLCLFGGPLYVPFKILNTVRLARTLSTPQRPVVPVFWMATEDHDRPEIDHTWMGDQRLHWPGEVGGPVGRMTLDGIGPVVDEAVRLLGGGPSTALVTELLRACWRPEHTVAQAMRRFVHGLFGHLGVICLDGDDPALKRLFAPVMRRELLERPTVEAVAQANALLAPHHTVQAHARPINLFHLRPGHRCRIEADGSGFRVLGGGDTFDRDGMLAALEAHPEDFSPNVLLRPLYQETILPNIAYIGGGGELAYWLQLKPVFAAFDVPMPVVLLRTSAAFISAKHHRQWTALGLSTEDLFAPQQPLQTRVASAHANFSVEVTAEAAALDRLFDQLADRAAAADPTLRRAVEARRTRALKDLHGIQKGLVRAARHRTRTVLHRMEAVQHALFPGGGLQERRQNILPMLAAHGMPLVEALLQVLDPLDGRFTLIEEDGPYGE
jgi:bacillithiol biosynthesis cysteine-adding enzyme BshC